MLHHFYRFVPLFKRLYRQAVWKLDDPKLFLTFDDGPHPTHTRHVLALLRKYDAKATFFIVGEQAEKYPEVIAQIIQEGHALGSHSYAHLNAWKNKKDRVLHGLFQGPILQNLKLYRPPYGRFTKAVAKSVKERGGQTIMWSQLSLDYDRNQAPCRVARNCVIDWRGGEILVFHDSEKAARNMLVGLTHTLEKAKRKGIKCAGLSIN